MKTKDIDKRYTLESTINSCTQLSNILPISDNNHDRVSIERRVACCREK